MNVHMCVCVHACIHGYMHVCTYVCTYIHIMYEFTVLFKNNVTLTRHILLIFVSTGLEFSICGHLRT